MEISSKLRVHYSNNPEKYLGSPNIVGQKKKAFFQHLRDRLQQKVDGSNRFFSQWGKKVFIKSVLQAIPNYAMACFLFPKSLCVDLEIILTEFWWQKEEDRYPLVLLEGVMRS